MKWVSKGKKKYSFKRFIYGFGYAFRGIFSSLKTEFNLIIEIIIGILAIVLGFFLNLSTIEFCIVILCTALVISMELINTAIEHTVDMAMPEKHPLAKMAKDASAGGVLFSCVGALAIGIIIYLPKVIDFFS